MKKKCLLSLLFSAALLVNLSSCSDESTIESSNRQIYDDKEEITVDKTVAFDWFEYQGNDVFFADKLPEGQFQNPIVAGFYPDPSITRKGDDFYMAVSSFSYTPGVPLLHSKDLVNWALIGHALTQKNQINHSGLTVSRGIYAPTIRYHDGLFYLITTAVDSGGNFFVTAEDPAGEWSEPYWLPEIGGIDPDIFFDDNGKVYITHNDAPIGAPLYQGHRAIWQWEYDMEVKQVVKNSGRVIVNGGADLSKQPIWIEAPHVYKINGWYYLMCAEGGTAYDHSEVIFRTKSLSQTFEPYAYNPILTQRDLDINRENPITTAGHADLIQTTTGQWWAVFLATRAYDKTYYNTGRETFLLPVTWQDNWPMILEQGITIPKQVNKPDIVLDNQTPQLQTEALTGNFTWRDNFDSYRSETHKLSPHWSVLRSVNDDWYTIESGKIHLKPAAITLASLQQPMFIARRQQHMTYQASTALVLPESERVSAGIVAFQNAKYHYYFAVKKVNQGYELFIEQANNGSSVNIINVIINPHTDSNASEEDKAGQLLTLTINGDKGDISFSYQLGDAEKITLAKNLDGKILSTSVAGGFVGSFLGIHTRIEL
jgi:alpha-N-arabinofuranosidase